MVYKVDISCSLCDADYSVNHDLERPYRIICCSFCGEQLFEDDLEVDDIFNDDIDEEDEY